MPAHILHVDLTRERTRRLPLAGADRRLEPGGRALAGAFLDATAHLAFDEPDALVGLFPGRLAGLGLPGASRLTAAFLSPVTGTVADAGCPGRLGGALARSGLAGVVVTGRAPGPRGLVIRDGTEAVVEASALAGQPTEALFAALGALDGALVTGPAALAGSRLAGAVADRWLAVGRGGLGLAMAAKNLLYVAAAGQKSVPVADPPGLATAREAILRLVAASPALGPNGLGRYGSAALLDLTHGRRMMPTDNFRATFFSAAPRLNAPRLDAGLGTRGLPCPGCPVGCHRFVPGGPSFPEADALSHFTALLGIDDGAVAVSANALCLRLGLDPVSVAATLACRAEITGGAPTPDDVLRLVAAMGTGRGLAGPDAALRGGAAAYAAGRGRPEAAMVVKGLELPAYDPRGACGLALSLAVGTAGPDAWRAGCLAHEMLRKPVATDRFSFEGKARAVFLGENAIAALESLGVCPWLALASGLEEWGQALAAVSGAAVTAGDLARLGERVVYRERMHNFRRGLTAADDDLPGRFFTEPGTGGDGLAVPPLSREAFLAARAKYYRLRGLCPDGTPGRERAATLELPWTR